MEKQNLEDELNALEKVLEDYGFQHFREVGPLYSTEPEPPITWPRRRREVAAITPAPKRRAGTSKDDPDLQRVVQRKATRPAKVCAGLRKPENPESAARSNKPRIISIERVNLPIVDWTALPTPRRPATPAPRKTTPTPTEQPAAPTTEAILEAPQATPTTHVEHVMSDGVILQVPIGYRRFRARVGGNRYKLRLDLQGKITSATITAEEVVSNRQNKKMCHLSITFISMQENSTMLKIFSSTLKIYLFHK